MRYNKLSHFSQPQHEPKSKNTKFPFTCDGCNEAGIGSCYECTKCKFYFHEHCVVPSPEIRHSFYTKCSFQFFPRPPGDKPRLCNACKRNVTGFVYHCRGCGFHLHPCCAKLPMMLDDGEVKLHLYKKVSALCQKCGREDRSWSYRSDCKKYNLHVACVKDMLMENWQDYIGEKRVRKFDNRIPRLKNKLPVNRSNSKIKAKKGWVMFGIVWRVVISALLGDPTGIILLAPVIGEIFHLKRLKL